MFWYCDGDLNTRMKAIEKDYFMNLFQQQHGERMVNAVNSSISMEDNNALSTPFSIVEFKDAIFLSMEVDK
ncbi:hypothetical protein A2U01_0056887, partial [Trifolium medium]|nr:hypothetical protein [Trifolium medium]